MLITRTIEMKEIKVEVKKGAEADEMNISGIDPGAVIPVQILAGACGCAICTSSVGLEKMTATKIRNIPGSTVYVNCGRSFVICNR